MKRDIQGGFTLIEITIALLILAIGLVGILTLFPVGFDAAGRSMHTTTATMLAQQLIEDCKVQGYDLLPGMHTGGVPATFGSPYDNYTYDIDITDEGTPDLRQIVVTVHRPDGRDTTLTTFLAKHEP